MIAKFMLVAVLLQGSRGFVISPKAGCELQLQSGSSEVIIADAATLKTIYPQSSKLDILVDADQKVAIGCPGGTLTYGSKNGTAIEAQCVSGSNFLVDGKEMSLSTLKCSGYSHHTARYSGNTCEANGTEIEIGWELDETRFVRIIRICFDNATKSTLYSMYNLPALIGTHEGDVDRPSFVEDTFYNLSKAVNTYYTNEVQRETINALVGLSPSSTKYVQSSSDYFLSRGHFTAKADFVYANQQRATFHYCNAAPQWQTFNDANWNSVEDSVRNYAQENSLDLDVYTGPYGIATLPHEETGEEIELYLSVEDSGLALLVPEVYWKLVYNPQTGENVVLIGANNPYKSELVNVCADISEKLSWVSWDTTDSKKGLSYACNAQDLKGIIPQLPDLEFTKLLL